MATNPPECLGINADCPRWEFSTFQLDPTSNKIQLAERNSFDVDDIQHGFFQWAESILVPLLDMNQVVDTSDPVQRALKAIKTKILVKDLTRHYQDHVDDWGLPDFLGVTHPYASTPLIRRMIPMLLKGNPIRRDQTASFTRPPKQCTLKDIVSVSAIDAPSAACLDLIAREHITLPVSLVLLTGPPAFAELTALDLTGVEDELHIKFRVAARTDVTGNLIVPPVHEKKLREFVLSRDSSNLRIVPYGSDLESAARQLQERFGQPSSAVFVQHPGALAAGAAMYAVLCGRQVLPGAAKMIRKLVVDHIFPRDLGVVGTNENDAWYWRRIWRAGDSLSGNALQVLRVGKTLPAHVQLAESERADSPRWIKQTDWGDELKLFVTVCPEITNEQSVGALEFNITNPAGLTEYRWSDTDVHITAGSDS